jgi:hypothetical protein
MIGLEKGADKRHTSSFDEADIQCEDEETIGGGLIML